MSIYTSRYLIVICRDHDRNLCYVYCEKVCVGVIEIGYGVPFKISVKEKRTNMRGA